jgi:hypothetical protein
VVYALSGEGGAEDILSRFKLAGMIRESMREW